jgi:hypothetical protein
LDAYNKRLPDEIQRLGVLLDFLQKKEPPFRRMVLSLERCNAYTRFIGGYARRDLATALALRRCFTASVGFFVGA